MTAWHAVCRDCDDFEEVDGEFDAVYSAAKEHEEETGHNVEGGKVAA
jgi:hypothetical protein